MTSIKVTVEGDIITLCNTEHSLNLLRSEHVMNQNCLLKNRKNNFIVIEKKLTKVSTTESASLSLSLLSAFFFSSSQWFSALTLSQSSLKSLLSSFSVSFFSWSLPLPSLQLQPQPVFTISNDTLLNNNRELTLN